jgi:3-dehydroquinate synthase
MDITVKLGDRSYPILLKHNAFDQFPAYLKQQCPATKYVIVTNATLAALYKEIVCKCEIELSCKTFIISDGEEFKTIDTWHSVVNFLLEAGCDRKSVVCALGGGVVGDIAGFAAASCLRGIRCVQIPTTLLAMVDSSVGGKTGVDHPLGKNLIGAFHQPTFVWLDTAFLRTLPKREFIAGYAELFKYAFIGGKDMFDFVNNNHDLMLAQNDAALLDGIERSVQIKASFVEQDEFETLGLRALLNFGHTFGHALERYYGFSSILHGEAIWFGMRCAFDLALRIGLIPSGAENKYLDMLTKFPSVDLPEKSKPDAQSLYAAMFTDKKTIGGKLSFVLPVALGESVLKKDVRQETVLQTINSILKTL